MAEFYGKLWGNRGVTTRCGSKRSGITCVLRSWRNEVRVELYRDSVDRDVLWLNVPEGLTVSFHQGNRTVEL